MPASWRGTQQVTAPRPASAETLDFLSSPEARRPPGAQREKERVEPTQTSEAQRFLERQTRSETAARGGAQRAVPEGPVDGQDLLSRPVLPGLSPVFLLSLLREAPGPARACSFASQHSHYLTASRRPTFSRVKPWGQGC